MEAVYVLTSDGNVFAGNLFVKHITNDDSGNIFLYVNQECFLDGDQIQVSGRLHLHVSTVIFARSAHEN